MPTLNKLTLNIQIEKDDDGTILVSDDLSLVYGEGTTLIEAIQDYLSSLMEYQEILKEQANANN